MCPWYMNYKEFMLQCMAIKEGYVIVKCNEKGLENCKDNKKIMRKLQST